LTAEAAPDAPASPAKPCANCGALATGAYCSACGQETDTRLPTLRKYMRDVTGGVVAVDGKLWRTLRALVTQPGFLTQEYLRGRRRYYVRPARMFLMLSLILFAVLRLTADPLRLDDASAKPEGSAGATSPANVRAVGNEISLGNALTIGLDRDRQIIVKGPPNVVVDKIRQRADHFNRLPDSEKGEQILSGLIRYAPYAMFVLLPVFAWLQQISYLGRTRRYPGRPSRYIEHLVYATHLHCVMFLAGIVALLVPFAWMRWLILVWLVIFVLRGKHRIYGGSRWGGLARTLFVVVAYTFFLTSALAMLIIPAILLA
jgi:Protein of unknown function (DUF3667)